MFFSEKIKKVRNSFSRAFAAQIRPVFSDIYSLIALFIVLTVFSLIAGWIPDGLAKIFFEGEPKTGFIMLIIALSLLLFLLLAAKWIIHPYKYEVISHIPSKKQALILFLSNVRGDQNKLEQLLKELKKFEQLEEKLNALNDTDFRSWRMPLEALKFHLGRLEKVIVITSDISSKQFKMFSKLVENFFPEKKIKLEEIKAKDFEDFHQVQEAIENAYKKLKEDGIKEKDTILDITGGQKIVSIVGALLSLNPGREFEYVSTTDYSVKSYDVEIVKEN
jgi:ABC-type multidrug transport system fused ATPase/permease subunit